MVSMLTPSSPVVKNGISHTKRFAFFLIMLIIPILLLGGIEIALRVLRYGSNVDLVVMKQVNGRTVYAINRSVARRYFPNSGTVIPEPADDSFEIQKSSRTKRIFCLGESTMAGFPFEYNATAASFLKDRLKTELPDYNVEVINVGLSAISSYVVADFVEDLVEYEPDLFIIYLGHNEFYGVYGSGSSVQVPGGHWLTKLTISLLRYKTFLALRDALAWVKGRIASSGGSTGSTLMEQMVRDQSIAYDSPEYVRTKEQYQKNLERIIHTAESRNVSIMFSTLVSNLKDHAPFRSLSDPALSLSAKEDWNRQFRQGDSLFEVGNFQMAAKAYARCSQIDTMNALAFFRLGRALLGLERSADSESSFAKAKDLDGLRFRASQDFEIVLQSVCNSNGVVLARVDSAFRVHSSNGIVGNELMLEHLHPNIRGYFLMGKTFANAIRTHGILLPPSGWQSTRTYPDEYYEGISGVTDFDSTVGRLKVDHLIHQWPFVQTDQLYSYVPRNALEQIALKYVRQKTFWSSARYDLAELYARSARYDKARAECFAVSKVIPFSYQPLLRIADYFALEGKRNLAKDAYERCIRTEDNPYARVKLAVILMEEDHPSEAIRQLQAGSSIAASGGFALTSQAEALHYYLLGVGNAKLANFDLARDFAQKALDCDPTFGEAKNLLAQLESVKRR
jgi:tetratricopeptide (TPR) repeat protein